MSTKVVTRNKASAVAPDHTSRGTVHHVDLGGGRSSVSRMMRSRSWWLKNSSLVRARAPSSFFRNVPSFCESRFSASAAAKSGNDDSNSTNSLPLNWPSSQAVHFSSSVFIHVSQGILQFLAGIKQTRHHRADGAAQALGNLMILHLFNFFHQNYGPVFG